MDEEKIKKKKKKKTTSKRSNNSTTVRKASTKKKSTSNSTKAKNAQVKNAKTVKKKQIKAKPKTKIKKTPTKKDPIEEQQTIILVPKKEIIAKIEKKKHVIIYQMLIFVLFAVGLYSYYYFNISPIPKVKSVYLDDDNNVNIIYKNIKNKRNKIYCYYSKEDKMPSSNDKGWKLTEDNTCSFKMEDDKFYAYLKNQDNIIVKVNGVENLGRIISINLDKNKVYLPINGTNKVNVSFKKIGQVDETIIWKSDDENVATVKDGKISGISNGTANISATIMNKSASVKVVVTNLITTRPKDGFDFKKPQLGCNKYSKEQNDLIDEILKNNINEVGYKTRAGAVEAARFLTLDFPYRINYFYENGRQTTNNVDGEGRYYHVGMYLHDSRYSSITGSQKGPKIWGCSMYDRPVKRQVVNGLDCSGFVSWALLNGGFDVKDVGAGWSNNLDLTDYGTVKKINSSVIKSNVIKVGDLLHSTAAGGHIGIIVGMDSSNYYVAQALWYNEIGVQITKIEKDKLYKTFPHVVLMDKYYKNDGNLTDMW